jgi:inner membrane protein
MDNFTHSLAGWALGQAGLKTKTRKGLAALILGANFPDVDVFFGWAPWEPLAVHRGWTHSFIGGAVLLPPILALFLYGLDRWQVTKGAAFKNGLSMHFGWLLALCFIGALTHPLLDLQTVYAVQLLSPNSMAWHHEESLFIIDVWLWTGVAAAIWASRKREKVGGNWRRTAQIGVAFASIYIAANWGLSEYTKHLVGVRQPEIAVERMFVGNEPVKFWSRDFVVRDADGRVGRGAYSPFEGYTAVTEWQPDNLNHPIAWRALTDPSIRDFSRWSLIPMAKLLPQTAMQKGTCEQVVRINDARYGDPRAAAGFTRDVTVKLTPEECKP